MQVKNISARGWAVGEVMIKPGFTETIDEEWRTAIKGNPDLEISGGEVVEEVVEEKRKPGRPAKTEE